MRRGGRGYDLPPLVDGGDRRRRRRQCTSRRSPQGVEPGSDRVAVRSWWFL